MNSIAARESDVAGDPTNRSGPARFVEIWLPSVTRYRRNADGTESIVQEVTHPRFVPFAPEHSESGPSVVPGERIEWRGNDRPAYLLWTVQGEWIPNGGKLYLRTLTHEILDAWSALHHARTKSASIGFKPWGERAELDPILDAPFESVCNRIFDGDLDGRLEAEPAEDFDEDLDRMVAEHLAELLVDADLDQVGEEDLDQVEPAIAGPGPIADRPAREILVVEFDPAPEGPQAPVTQLGFGWSEPPAAKPRPRRKGSEGPGEVPGWKGDSRV